MSDPQLSDRGGGIGIATVVVIGGTATAASQIPVHELATGSVNGRVVQDGSSTSVT